LPCGYGNGWAHIDGWSVRIVNDIAAGEAVDEETADGPNSRM